MNQLFSIQVRDSSDCSETFSRRDFISSANSSIFDVVDADDFATSGHCNEPDIDNLSDYNYVIPFFLSIYLLIGNVMLLNLLIAIFT